MFKNKNILVTGGSGMIGRQLVSLLLLEDANVHVADLNKPINMSQNIIFHNIDLKDFNNCKEVCKNMDYVFNLVGIKCFSSSMFRKTSRYYGTNASIQYKYVGSCNVSKR